LGLGLGSFLSKVTSMYLQKPGLKGKHKTKKSKQEIILRSFLAQILIFIVLNS
jgi:hypothetical protein